MKRKMLPKRELSVLKKGQLATGGLPFFSLFNVFLTQSRMYRECSYGFLPNWLFFGALATKAVVEGGVI
jgi:hypothetical protein